MVDQLAVVRAAPVTDTVLARPIVATGTVAPADEAALGFKIGGVIERIAVDAGDLVRAGQTLAALDLREIDAGLAKARSGAAKAERDLARARRLYADSVVTLAQFQDAETADELARADLEAAAFNRRYAVIVAPASGVVLRRAAEPGENIAAGATVLVVGSRGAGRGNVLRDRPRRPRRRLGAEGRPRRRAVRRAAGPRVRRAGSPGSARPPTR